MAGRRLIGESERLGPHGESPPMLYREACGRRRKQRLILLSGPALGLGSLAAAFLCYGFLIRSGGRLRSRSRFAAHNNNPVAAISGWEFGVNSAAAKCGIRDVPTGAGFNSIHDEPAR